MLLHRELLFSLQFSIDCAAQAINIWTKPEPSILSNPNRIPSGDYWWCFSGKPSFEGQSLTRSNSFNARFSCHEQMAAFLFQRTQIHSQIWICCKKMWNCFAGKCSVSDCLIHLIKEKKWRFGLSYLNGVITADVETCWLYATWISSLWSVWGSENL